MPEKFTKINKINTFKTNKEVGKKNSLLAFREQAEAKKTKIENLKTKKVESKKRNFQNKKETEQINDTPENLKKKMDAEILETKSEFNPLIEAGNKELEELLLEEQRAIKELEDLKKENLEKKEEGKKPEIQESEEQLHLNKLEDLNLQIQNAEENGDIEKGKRLKAELLKAEREWDEKFGKEISNTENTPINDTENENINNESETNKTPLTPEELEKFEKLMKGCESEKQQIIESSPYANKISKGISWYENLGKDENGNPRKDLKGFLQRMGKMSANLALIGVCSMASVDALAKHGIGSATALAGGMTSKLGIKMAMGLGLGGAMDIGGGKLPTHIKKWMPLYMGVGGVALASGMAIWGGALAAGVITSGAIAGGASAFGYISSKYMPKFATQRMEEKEKKAIEKMFEKYKIGPLDEDKSEEAKEEYAKIIKHYQKMRIFGKLADGAIKLVTGTAVAGAIMEASGLAQDHNTKVELQKHLEAEKVQHTATTEKLTLMKELHEARDAEMHAKAQLQSERYADLNKQIDTELKAEAEAQAKIEADNKINIEKLAPQAPREEATFEDTTSDNTQTENTDSPKMLITPEEIKTEVPIQTPETNPEVQNPEEHTFSTNEHGVSSKIHFQYNENGEIAGSSIEGKVTGLNPYSNNTELNRLEGLEYKEANSELIVLREQIELLNKIPHNTPEYDYLKHEIEKQEDYIIKNYGNVINVDKLSNSINNESQINIDKLAPRAPEEASFGTNEEKMDIINNVYHNNINHLFPDPESMEIWDSLKNSTTDHSAYNLMHTEMTDSNQELHSIISHFQKLEEVTGLSPIEANLINPIPETPQEFEIRCYEKAAEMGPEYLEKLKL